MMGRLRAWLAGTRAPADLAAEALARVPREMALALYPSPLVPAAVLVGLVPAGTGWEVLLTRRTDHLRDHPGQISFPGGRLEAADEGPVAAALRETEEEVGIAPALVDVLGYLPPHPVVTGFAVSPVVGLIRPGFQLRPDPMEVAEIFGVPLDYLLRDDAFAAGQREVRGVTVPVYSCQHGRHLIWGATAHILHTLREGIHGRLR